MRLPLQFRHYLAFALLVLLGLAVRNNVASGTEAASALPAPAAGAPQLVSAR